MFYNYKIGFKQEKKYLFLVLLLGLVLRIYFWSSQLSDSLLWDESSHVLAGLMLAKFVATGFHQYFIVQVINNYWAVMGSLFFYPYGYTILSMLSFLFFGFNELAARLPSMFFSVLIIFTTYLLAKKLFNEKIGLISAFFAAINPYFIFWGGFALVDLPMACLMELAIYFCLQGLNTDKIKHWLASGICVGLASLMKPPGLIIIPFLMVLVICHHGLRGLLKKTFIWFLLPIIICVGIYFGFGFVAFVVLPKLNIINQAVGQHIFSDIFHWFGNPTYINATTPGLKTLAAWRFYFNLLPIQMGGFLVIVLCLLGAVRLWLAEDRQNFYRVIGYILYIYLIFTLIYNKIDRYTIVYLFGFCLLAAIGLDYLTSLFGDIRKKFSIAAMLLLIFFFSFSQLIRQYSGHYFSDLKKAAKFISQSDSGTIVMAEETNVLNVNNVSFYMIMSDAGLSNSVSWPNRINQAQYIISDKSKKLDRKNIEPIFGSVNMEVFKILR